MESDQIFPILLKMCLGKITIIIQDSIGQWTHSVSTYVILNFLVAASK